MSKSPPRPTKLIAAYGSAVFVAAFGLLGCQTPAWLHGSAAEKPPGVSAQSPGPWLRNPSSDDGKAQWTELESYILEQLAANDDPDDDELKAALTAYFHGPCVQREAVFSALLKHRGDLERKYAWRLAKAKPSPRLKQIISRKLTEAMTANDLSGLMRSDVAEAVVANQIPNAYTFLRRGLEETGSTAFARAMQTIDPAMASADFMTYLGRAAIPKLLAGKVDGIDPATAALMLKFLAERPPGLDHPNFGHLFFYAFIDQPTMAEDARRIVLAKAAYDPGPLAFLLAKMPQTVQISYVRILNDEPGRPARRLIEELRKVTPTPAVVATIDAAGF